MTYSQTGLADWTGLLQRRPLVPTYLKLKLREHRGSYKKAKGKD